MNQKKIHKQAAITDIHISLTYNHIYHMYISICPELMRGACKGFSFVKLGRLFELNGTCKGHISLVK